MREQAEQQDDGAHTKPKDPRDTPIDETTTNPDPNWDPAHPGTARPPYEGPPGGGGQSGRH